MGIRFCPASGRRCAGRWGRRSSGCAARRACASDTLLCSVRPYTVPVYVVYALIQCYIASVFWVHGFVQPRGPVGVPGDGGDEARGAQREGRAPLRRLRGRAVRGAPRGPNSRNPRHFSIIEGRRVYQALYVESKSVLDALCRVKKRLRRSI